MKTKLCCKGSDSKVKRRAVKYMPPKYTKTNEYIKNKIKEIEEQYLSKIDNE